MRSLSRWTKAVVLVAFAALATAALALPAGAQDSGSEDTVLKIGWAQNPQTINPFVGQDEESYTIWALTWDLLVNFSPEDLSPAPGIAESWDISEDRKTITFHLVHDAKWSDGEPITSADVKYSLDVLGGEGTLFTGYTDNVTSVQTPDDETVVIKTKRPDARIVGGLFIYMLPEHVWGKVDVDELTGSYQPDTPMVGSGPYVVTDFQKGRITTMEKNPEFRGPEPKFDKIEFITYGNQDAAERALQLGEVDLVPEVSAANFERLGTEDNIDTRRSSTPAYTQLAFNMCSDQDCPDAEFNPAVQDRAVRQAIGYAVDRGRINAIAAHDTSFPAYGVLPDFYRSFYEVPEMDYAFDPDKANQILDAAGWERQGDGPRTKGGEELSFDVFVRSESPYDIQAAKLVSEMTADVGIEFNVQVVSTDKLYDLTVRKVDGKPAPAFDTFIWGWGGDPYDPSFLLSVLTSEQIGGNSDSFYSNAEYDRLFDQQAGSFDTATRKELIQRMVAITQRDLPYLVLTYDPNLEAYRTDRLANVEPVCPAGENGDVFCDQVSYEPLLMLEPGTSSSADEGGGAPTGLIIVAAVVVIGGVAYLVVRSRRRGREPLEMEE